jgi:peroxiredoxin
MLALACALGLVWEPGPARAEAPAETAPATPAPAEQAPAEQVAGKSRMVLQSGPMRVGEKSPSFAGWGLDGSLITLSQLLPAPPGALVVSFFATWCKPCEQSLPALARTVQSLQARNVRALLVAYGEGAEAVRPFVEAHSLGLPVLLDPFTKISQRLGVGKALPRTFVLDGEGRVRAIFETEGEDFEAALRLALLAAIQPMTASSE